MCLLNGKSNQKFKRNIGCIKMQKKYIYIHLIIGLLSLIGYANGGIYFKILMIPYTAWLVLKKDAYYMPALLVHCTSSTLVMPVIYLMFAFLSIKNFSYFKSIKLFVPFLLLIALFPLFSWLFLAKYKATHDFIASIMSLNMYLSFFAFFYGTMIIRTLDNIVIKAFIFTLFSLLILHLLDINNSRLIFFAYPLFIGVLSYAYFYRSTKLIYFIYIFISLLSLIVLLADYTFTLFFSSILALLFVGLYYSGQNKSLFKMTGLYAYLLVLVIMVFGVLNYMQIENVADFADPNTNLAFTERMKFKLFADRAPFWDGAVKQIGLLNSFLPPIEVPNITATLIDNRDVEVSFGGHNIYLELVRNYGYLAGILLCFLYLFVGIVGRNIFLLKKINPLFMLLVAASVSIHIIGGLTGTYPVTMNFSIANFTILGAAYALTQKKRTITPLIKIPELKKMKLNTKL